MRLLHIERSIVDRHGSMYIHFAILYCLNRTNEQLQNIAPPKPDQLYLLEWLERKFAKARRSQDN